MVFNIHLTTWKNRIKVRSRTAWKGEVLLNAWIECKSDVESRYSCLFEQVNRSVHRPTAPSFDFRANFGVPERVNHIVDLSSCVIDIDRGSMKLCHRAMDLCHCRRKLLGRGF